MVLTKSQYNHQKHILHHHQFQCNRLDKWLFECPHSFQSTKLFVQKLRQRRSQIHHQALLVL